MACLEVMGTYQQLRQAGPIRLLSAVGVPEGPKPFENPTCVLHEGVLLLPPSCAQRHSGKEVHLHLPAVVECNEYTLLGPTSNVALYIVISIPVEASIQV